MGELEALYAAYKAYGPPPAELAQEPTYSDVKAHLYAYGPPSDLEAAQEYDGPTYSEFMAALYELTDSEIDELYEMYKAYGMPSEEDLEAMYAFYKEYGM